jgi:hypothetical protein
VWKERLLKLLKLRDRGVVFKPQLYDFLYVPERHSVGLIVELRDPQTFGVAFFPSLNNHESYYAQVVFQSKTTLVIPSFETLMQRGHQLMKRESWSSSHPDVILSGGETHDSVKFKLYGRLSSRFKASGDGPDYETLLDLVATLSSRPD